ncbi:MAG: hypothetical protein GX829_01785 [Clostridium sp.]|nr:hypothetical protein [Clostridium sp.]
MKNSFISIILDNFLLILGLISLLLVVDGQFYYAGILILLAGVYAYFQVKVVNFFDLVPTPNFNDPSPLLVFVISPLILIYLLFSFRAWGFLGILPIFLFSMAGVHQLKKDHNSNQTKSLFLLPLPIAAVAITFLTLVLQGSSDLRFIIYAVVIIFSYLMIRPSK